MEQSSLQLIHDVGTRLSKQSLPTKDYIIKSLQVNSRQLSKYTAYDEGFIGSVIKGFQSQVTLPAHTFTRGDQKFMEGIMQTNTNLCSSMSMRACKQVETISSRSTKANKTANQEIIVGRRRKWAVSPKISTSIELQEISQVQQSLPTNRERSTFFSQCETTEGEQEMERD